MPELARTLLEEHTIEGGEAVTIYYRDTLVQVTTQWFTVGDRRFAIQDLHNPRVARTEGDRGTLGAGIAAVLLVQTTIAVELALHSYEMWALATSAAAGVAVAAMIRAHRRQQVCELWAEYRGETVRAYRTRDAREFGQVTRALMRAIEHAGIPPETRSHGGRRPLAGSRPR